MPLLSAASTRVTVRRTRGGLVEERELHSVLLREELKDYTGARRYRARVLLPSEERVPRNTRLLRKLDDLLVRHPLDERVERAFQSGVHGRVISSMTQRICSRR